MNDVTNPQYQPQPKKKHTVRNVFLILVGLSIAAFAGCTALIGGALEEADDAVSAEEENDKPSRVVEGKAFEHDIWAVKPGWRVVNGPLGDATIKGLRVEHIGDEQDTAMLTFQAERGKKVLANIECTGNEVQPGQVVRMSCLGTGGAVKGNYKLTVKDMW